MSQIKQLYRFGFVGIVATAVHVAIGSGLHYGLHVDAFVANLIAFCCALGVSFLGQTRLTFPDSTADGVAFMRFATVALTGLALNQSLVWLITSQLGYPYWLSLAIIISTVPGVTFLLLKFWALRR